MEKRLLNAKVIPNAKKFELTDDKNGQTVIYTKSPAQKNQANLEIIRELHKKFNQKITIVKGHQSRRKLIQIG